MLRTLETDIPEKSRQLFPQEKADGFYELFGIVCQIAN